MLHSEWLSIWHDIGVPRVDKLEQKLQNEIDNLKNKILEQNAKIELLISLLREKNG